MFGDMRNFGDGLFDQFRRMQEEMDQMFGTASWPNGIRTMSRGAYPPVNIGSTQDQIDVYLFAAGIDPNSLDISIQQNLLTVAGERPTMAEEGANYYRRERFNGAFRRVLNLPEDVDPGRVTANYRNGLLHITVLRREAAKPRKIQVQ